MTATAGNRPQPVATVGSEQNRTVARLWIDAFNTRDDPAEAAARTVDYVAHAPESIDGAALVSTA